MNSTEYKKYHESFMKNNHGTSQIQTFMHILFTVQGTIYCCLKPRCSKKTNYIFEYMFIILPMILADTFFANYIYMFNVVMFTFLLYECFIGISEINIKEALLAKNSYETRISSVTCMRGLTYLITVFCILAVDFQDFPRYLAKTERFGYSLMDTGVGLFVVMSGLVHKNLSKRNYSAIFKDNYKLFSILIFLGAARCVAVKELDYQEHITEYGVHWNFFFTIAVCKLLSLIILMFVSHRVLWTSIVMICIHEFCLFSGLQAWVFSDAPRDNLLNANREGIVSCMGYVSIYLFAVHLKLVLRNESISKINIIKKLASYSLSLWTLSLVLNLYRPTSRALANMSYCTYISGVTITVLMILFFFETVYHKTFSVPSILLAINRNGLTFFLIANVLTGLINKIMRTILLSSVQTFIILNIYMLATALQVIYLNERIRF